MLQETDMRKLQILVALIMSITLSACATVPAGSPAERWSRVAVALAPAVLAEVNRSGFDPLRVPPERLVLYGIACQYIAAELEEELLVTGQQGCGFVLDMLEARNVDLNAELSD
jgi:hypothetical protein